MSESEGSPTFIVDGTMAYLVPNGGQVAIYLAADDSEVYIWDGDNIILSEEYDPSFVVDMIRQEYPGVVETSYEGLKETTLPVVLRGIIDPSE